MKKIIFYCYLNRKKEIIKIEVSKGYSIDPENMTFTEHPIGYENAIVIF
ncbi:MAG: hypothetical protein US04_C0001G0118 [Candidatus Nomurabacteria bacterium GW2011_GWD2_36_14]|nr:MAG: hypothetical protein UR97_C0004G0125 [Candidatus Nomurabacteria bacterium GW2011_GWE2_36_115]KKP94256.1 MAG: hypothetical protein US00_C0003G0180 [Candidatus Nomurabacteria bacterium GW2011_GWF2_36_126]KKP96616.1 MAG: hypothetical protein US04_C0001G0118 [Candidatus Nomurabacteria bacterium GW2011_GWD2_36_14]KKP99780.1 MAG: hypothetical protein US08_C0001G0463 [Candidatus Nomurabacteria bacterium GW2011_GWF2_36_19]KKQ05274.1 MAG: hypothetical protein US17_C0005G0041 [Candidatus Nomuraba